MNRSLEIKEYIEHMIPLLEQLGWSNIYLKGTHRVHFIVDPHYQHTTHYTSFKDAKKELKRLRDDPDVSYAGRGLHFEGDYEPLDLLMCLRLDWEPSGTVSMYDKLICRTTSRIDCRMQDIEAGRC